MDFQSSQTIQLIKTFSEKGKSYLEEAAKEKNSSFYQNAIEEFRRAYNHALLLDSNPKAQRSCLFNLASCYIEAEDYLQAIDVLLSLLDSPIPSDGSEPTKADIYFNIGFAYDKIDDKDKAIKYYRDAWSNYRLISTEFSLMHCRTLVNLGQAYQAKGDHLEAIDLLTDAAKRYLNQNLYELGCETLLKKGDILIGANNFTACEALLDECVDFATKIKDQHKKSVLFHNIGLKLTLLGQFKKSVVSFEKALEACPPHERNHYGRVLQDLGVIYNRLNDYEKAVWYHKESIQVYGKLGNRNAQGQCFFNLAFAQIHLKEFEQAKENYQHALQAFKDTDDENGEWQVCEGLGGIAVLAHDWNKAIAFYQQSILSQARLKSDDSSVQSRLLKKLTDAIREQLLYSHNNGRNSIKNDSTKSGYLIRPPSRRQDSREIPLAQSNFPVIANTEVDRVYLEPRQISRPEPVGSSQLKRALNKGRRGFHNPDGKPFVQVARGLSSFSEFSMQNLILNLDEDDDISILSPPDDDIVPHALVYGGRIYNVNPKSFKEVSHDLQSMSHTARQWRGTRQDPGAKTEVMFEEPIPSLSSDVARKKTKPSLKKRSTELGASKTEMGGLSVSDDEEELKETKYADHYKKQLKDVEMFYESSSSSSSSSEEDKAKVNSVDPSSSMPKRSPPKPPKKPPRKKKSTPPPQKHDDSQEKDSSLNRSGRKNLRFLDPPGRKSPSSSDASTAGGTTSGSPLRPRPSLAPPVITRSDVSTSSSSVSSMSGYLSQSSRSEDGQDAADDIEMSSNHSQVVKNKKSKFCSVM